ncbi:hypothetical protein BBP40_001577 [Aspergillus hancockii]|nr:hypothetical protein BBP40_001577 [Aspergillus hancockii]
MRRSRRGSATSNKRTEKKAVSEHRRTQLRRAQQAYRHRKETESLSLKSQVEKLQKNIKELHRTFQAYNEAVETSSVLSYDSILREVLQQIREQFLAISAAARVEEEPSSTFQTDENASIGTLRRKRGGGLQQTEHDLAIAASRLVGDRLYPANPGSSSDMADPEGNNQPSETLSGNCLSSATPSVQTVEHPGPLPCNTDDSAILHILCPAHLLSSSTFSFRETSFERRLHRACLENGYRLLVDPTTDPDSVKRVFGLPLTLSKRDAIVQRVKGLLEGGLDEAPEMWDTPFFLLGGAGTHYPRRDRRGRPILPLNALPADKFVDALVHQTAEPQPFHSNDDLLAGLGLDGEWFDSYDVEGYLKEKGIFLDADTAFCKIPERAFSTDIPPSDTIAANVPHAVGNQTPAQGQMYPHNVDRIDIQPSGDLQRRRRRSYMQPSSLGDVDLIQNNPDTNGYWVLDVGLFVEHLIQSGICLGRCPGFRREDVESTFRLAMCRTFLNL